jgi:hypothetical protein
MVGVDVCPALFYVTDFFAAVVLVRGGWYLLRRAGRHQPVEPPEPSGP